MLEEMDQHQPTKLQAMEEGSKANTKPQLRLQISLQVELGKDILHHMELPE